MKQETIKHPGNSFNASFQQKSTGLSLLITSSLAIYYLVNMWPMRPIALTSDSLPTGYGNLVLSTVVLFIAAQIVLQIVLAIGAGADVAATAHEQTAALKAKRNAYGVLTAGMMAAVAAVFLA